MKWHDKRTMIAGALSLAVSGCGMVDGRGDNSLTDRLPVAPASAGVSDFPVKLGAPYKVGATTYTPEDRADYDEVGYASWYGDELTGRNTANGESFNPDGISAAHRTLPLPSYVEVTALDTGRTILVRVNDRGPFSNDRLIDLSQGAARQLGISGQGHAPVRVRRVNPPEAERMALRQGNAAAERLESPEMMLTALRRKLGVNPKPPAPVVAANPVPQPASAKPVSVRPASAKPTPVAATNADGFIIEQEGRPASSAPRPAPAAAAPAGQGWYVQIAAFSGKDRADSMAKRAGARVDRAGSLYRVRFGPYASEAQANESLRSIRAKGYPEARILSGG